MEPSTTRKAAQSEQGSPSHQLQTGLQPCSRHGKGHSRSLSFSNFLQQDRHLHTHLSEHNWQHLNRKELGNKDAESLFRVPLARRRVDLTERIPKSCSL